MHQAPLVHRQPAGELFGGGPIAETADIQNQGIEHFPQRPIAEREDGAVQHPGQALKAVLWVVVRDWVWRCFGRPVHGRWLAVGLWARGRHRVRG